MGQRSNRNFISIGERFGRLVAISIHSRATNRQVRWLCRCDCGALHSASSGNLRRGKIKSCGCLFKEQVGRFNFRHGHTMNGKKSSTYGIWDAMLARCLNEKNHNYSYYGGRGITVCESWLRFENFLADMGERPSHLTLERVDNNQGYYPENCIWATMKQHSNNRRTPAP